MARTIQDAKLGSRTARACLKVSGKPYWKEIERGLHLGYRKGKVSGRWVMRRYLGGARPYQVETVGTADDSTDADGSVFLSFAQAQAKIRQLYVERTRPGAGLAAGNAGPYRVQDAVAEYIGWLEEHRKSARSIRWTAEAAILPDLGTVECSKLSADDIRRWQEKVAKEPARLRTRQSEPQQYRSTLPDQVESHKRQRRATANRKLVILKAALNKAWREGKVPSDGAWRIVKPYREADVARLRYLTVAEAQRILNAADPDLRDLLRAALLTGCRYAELTALVASDFNPDSGTLHIRTSKSGKGRHVVLTEEGVAFFRFLSAARSSQEQLFLKSNGSLWLKSHQHRPMREACKRARIEPPVSFHTARHSYASLTIMGGAPLMVVARNLGHADTRMVERHYGHLAPSFVADAIRAAAPRFGQGTTTTLEVMRAAL